MAGYGVLLPFRRRRASLGQLHNPAFNTYVSEQNKAKQIEIIENRKNKKLALDEKRRQSEGAEEEDMDEDDIEEVDSDEWDEDDEDEEEEPIARTDCFFCLHHSSNMEKNAIHMATEHSFFLPDVEYLVDMPGLFEYLGAKVCN